MFNLMDYRQGEEIKERLDRLEKKIDEVLEHFNQADRWVKERAARLINDELKSPTPKKKGK